MSIGAPEAIYLALFAIILGYTLAKDGEPQPPYSFGRSLVGGVLILTVLWWGGFFA